MTKRLVIANWKAYLEQSEKMRALALALKRREKNFKKADVWLAPPYPFIQNIVGALKSSHIRVGAQGVSAFDPGAHTGEVTAGMLRGVGASFAIIGHSERRAMGESNESVHGAVLVALAAGLRVVLCIGEHERDEHGEHFAFLETQLRTALAGVARPLSGRLVVAYEPIWAIGRGAGDAASPEIIRETSIFIRKILADLFGRESAIKASILYGGSVEGENAAPILERGDVGGFLVGHASADVARFLQIIEACQG